MDASQLLETLTARGARVSLEGEALVVKPRTVLTEELRAAVRAAKPELLALLHQGEHHTPTAPETAPEPAAEINPETLFWNDIATAIAESRRGALLAVTVELLWALQAARVVTGRKLTVAELCELSREKQGAGRAP